jgi:hypothetical protein
MVVVSSVAVWIGPTPPGGRHARFEPQFVTLNEVKGTISSMAPFAEFTLSVAKGSG